MALRSSSLYSQLLVLVLGALLPTSFAAFVPNLVCRRLIVPSDTSDSAEEPFCLPVVPSSRKICMGRNHPHNLGHDAYSNSTITKKKVDSDFQCSLNVAGNTPSAHCPGNITFGLYVTCQQQNWTLMDYCKDALSPGRVYVSGETIYHDTVPGVVPCETDDDCKNKIVRQSCNEECYLCEDLPEDSKHTQGCIYPRHYFGDDPLFARPDDPICINGFSDGYKRPRVVNKKPNGSHNNTPFIFYILMPVFLLLCSVFTGLIAHVISVRSNEDFSRRVKKRKLKRRIVRARKQKAAAERAAVERAAAERVDDGGETGFSVIGEQHEGRAEAGVVDLQNALEERVEVDESEGSDEKIDMEWEESVDESSVDESNDDEEELENEVEEVGDSAGDLSAENESHISQPLLKK